MFHRTVTDHRALSRARTWKAALGSVSATAIVVSLVASTPIAFAAPLTEAQKQEAEILVRGIRDSRERLMSGECHVAGYDVALGSQNRVPVDCHIVFDYGNQQYRFDRNTPAADGVTRGGKYLRTNAHTFHSLGRESGAVVRDRLSGRVSALIAPFDIRSVGLFNLVGDYWMLTYTEFFRNLDVNGEMVGCSKEGELHVITWVLGDANDPLTEKLWVDEANGYSCVRLEMSGTNLNTTMESSWEPVEGAWVPTALRIDDQQGDMRGKSEWHIEWTSVNRPVDTRYFTPESFPSQDQPAALFSRELGDRVVRLRELGTGDSPALGASEPRSRRVAYMMLGAGVAVVVVVTVFVSHRRAAGK